MKAKAYQNNGMKTAANAAQQGGRDQDPRHTGQGDKNKVDPSRKGYDQGSRQDQAGKNPMGGERNR